MVQMKELIAKKYEEKIKEAERMLTEKERELTTIKNEISSLEEKKKNKHYQKFFIEKKHKGERILLHKHNYDVSLFSDSAEDVTSKFYKIAKQGKELANADLILDCEYVGNDSKEVLYAFDCLYYGRDLTGLPLFERKKILKSLKFTDNIKESGSIVVENKETAIKTIELFSNMAGSKGAIIKKYDSKYVPNANDSDWLAFKLKDETND